MEYSVYEILMKFVVEGEKKQGEGGDFFSRKIIIYFRCIFSQFKIIKRCSSSDNITLGIVPTRMRKCFPNRGICSRVPTEQLSFVRGRKTIEIVTVL